MKRISALIALMMSSGSMLFSAQLAKALHHPAGRCEEAEADEKISNIHRSLH